MTIMGISFHNYTLKDPLVKHLIADDRSLRVVKYRSRLSYEQVLKSGWEFFMRVGRRLNTEMLSGTTT